MKQTKINSILYSNYKSLVICGPSGVGKGTIINQILTDYPNTFELSISRTSRAPRPNEVNGEHYYFLTMEELKKDIENNNYIEYNYVHNNLYGTRLDSVTSIHDKNKICILDLDSKGVKQIKANNFPARSIFILPPSIHILEERLRNRKTEKEEDIKLRISNSIREIEYGTTPGNFDKVVTNNDLDNTMNELYSILNQWFPKFNIKTNNNNNDINKAIPSS